MSQGLLNDLRLYERLEIHLFLFLLNQASNVEVEKGQSDILPEIH